VLQSVLTAYAVLLLFGIVEVGDPPFLVARLGLLLVVPLGFGAALANKVTVIFRNAQGVGLTTATAEVDCDTPPPELTFEHVPADDRRVCDLSARDREPDRNGFDVDRGVASANRKPAELSDYPSAVQCVSALHRP
jgi:hypothetical protein